MRQRTPWTVVLCVFGVLWCGLLALGVVMDAVTGCWGDTSYCAESREKNGTYAGVLRDDSGRILRDTEFNVGFESRADEAAVGGFRTDARGRYCIVWANERILPDAYPGSGDIDDGTRSSNLDGTWRPLRGADPPANCQQTSAGVPWNRADSASDSPWFVFHLLLPLAASGWLLLGLGGGFVGRFARRVGVVLAIVCTALANGLF